MEYREIAARDLASQAEAVCSDGKYNLTAMFAND